MCVVSKIEDRTKGKIKQHSNGFSPTFFHRCTNVKPTLPCMFIKGRILPSEFKSIFQRPCLRAFHILPSLLSDPPTNVNSEWRRFYQTGMILSKKEADPTVMSSVAVRSEPQSRVCPTLVNAIDIREKSNPHFKFEQVPSRVGTI